MPRYRFSVEFDSEGRPDKWFWSDMLDFDDDSDNTVVDWSTWNLVNVND